MAPTYSPITPRKKSWIPEKNRIKMITALIAGNCAGQKKSFRIRKIIPEAKLNRERNNPMYVQSLIGETE